MPENYHTATDQSFRYALLSQMEDLNLNLGNMVAALDRIADALEIENEEMEEDFHDPEEN